MSTRTTLLTGASGHLGSLIGARLLAESDNRLIMPVRNRHTRESVLARIVHELEVTGHTVPSRMLERVIVLPLPASAEILAMRDALRGHGVTEIIHSAGCVDYFNTHSLNLGNIELTKALVELGQALDVKRFCFISTAFSSGFRDDLIPEKLHEGAINDPTEYTRTKRDAEVVVAQSGLPYVIIRPSVVIGDSRDGHYGGKRYGIYQLWHAAERFLCADYLERIYALGPELPLPVLHQDAFQSGFMAAYRTLEPPAVFHLVSRDHTLPTVRDLWDQWLETVARPREIHYYDRLDDVPMETLSRQQQILLEFSSVNVDIGIRRWHFETKQLESMQAAGLHFVDATATTLRVCQDRFIADSPRVQEFLKKYERERQVTPRVIDRSHLLTASVG
jgi:thioester reductase-like protein